MVDEERCNELRKALADARARLEPGARDTVIGSAFVVNQVQPPDLTPDAPSVGLEEDIRNLEQALHEAGCE